MSCSYCIYSVKLILTILLGMAYSVLQIYSQFSLTLSGTLGPIHIMSYLLAVNIDNISFYWALDVY